MERVTDSVQQILKSCESMIEETRNVEFVDIWSLANTLKIQSGELKNLFETDPANEKGIMAKKQAVEATAIRLEFYMYTRLGTYEERYKLRKYAKKIYEDCRLITLQLAKDKSVSGIELDEWGSRTRWALAFWSRSTHIIFETDEEDEKHIKDIVESIKRVEGAIENAG